ncbi:hypothetical protein ACEXQB_001555 [Herbiconiux sp. P18]|uniref:hypothetical protein n=1 Tax=Herbiconiux liangxiaofengii TaxID=3342795 RepID=UPI0035B81992
MLEADVMLWTFSLLRPHLSKARFDRYSIRLRCAPQPAMRAVQRDLSGYTCYGYIDFEWTVQGVYRDKADATQWWLDDPWMPATDIA